MYFLIWAGNILCRFVSLSAVVPELSSWKNSLRLTIADKMILESEHQWLNANHISASHKLLQKMHPSQNGLQDTSLLLEKSIWNSSPDDFVQVVHVGGNHWACLSNIFSKPGSVDLYDSLHTIPSEEGSIVQQACTILKYSGELLTINVINVQLQIGFNDCGLFAIAMATDLCAGRDPLNIRYSQSLMRKHLKSCFESDEQLLKAFPSAEAETPAKRLTDQLIVGIFCLCRKPELSKRMACCDRCDTWFHEDCVNIPESVFEDDTDKLTWECNQCK